MTANCNSGILAGGKLHRQRFPDPCSYQAWYPSTFPPTACQDPPWQPQTPTLTQRQDNQGQATQGHPSEGPCDGQHRVGHGGSAQHPKNHGAHQGQLEHGLPSEPAWAQAGLQWLETCHRSRVWNGQTRDFRGKLKDAACWRGGSGSGSSWCHSGAIPCRAHPINIGNLQWKDQHCSEQLMQLSWPSPPSRSVMPAWNPMLLSHPAPSSVSVLLHDLFRTGHCHPSQGGDRATTLSPCSLEGKHRNPIVSPHVQIALKS